MTVASNWGSYLVWSFSHLRLWDIVFIFLFSLRDLWRGCEKSTLSVPVAHVSGVNSLISFWTLPLEETP
jgi:hypothetical protein